MTPKARTTVLLGITHYWNTTVNSNTTQRVDLHHLIDSFYDGAETANADIIPGTLRITHDQGCLHIQAVGDKRSAWPQPK